jgi:glucosylceramidase
LRRRAPTVAVLVFGLLVPVLAVPGAAVAARHKPRGLPRSSVQVTVVLTSANLKRALTTMPSVPFSGTAPRGARPVINVDETQRFQSIRGVGGAMTDSSAWLLEEQLAPGTRAWLMRRLFGPQGIDIRFLRVPMAASDYTALGIPYTYDSVLPGQADPTLAHFSILHDVAYVLPALRQALAVAPHAFVMATPWSPPAWMKTNGTLGNPANAPGWLDPAYYGAMAKYFVRFVQAYAAAGVPISAVTAQNEPGQLTAYPGMNMTEANEATFIADDLAPALNAAGLHTKIYGYDNNWYNVGVAVAHQLERGPAGPDLAGISSHCYFGVPSVLSALHAETPSLDQIVSECSPGNLPFSTSQIEIASIRNWASVLALWNLALDHTGGPVELPNYGCLRCTAIVTVNDLTHTLTFTRDYYELGQLSRYVHPGAVRIASNHFVSYRYFPIPDSTATGRFSTPGLDDVAFENRDGSRVLLAYNSGAAPIAFAVRNDGYYFSYRLAPGNTGTFIWKSPVP